MHSRLILVAFLVASVPLTACRREQPPPPPPPAEETTSEPAPQEDRDDDEARRAAEERARAVAEARGALEQRVHFDYDESTIRPDTERILLEKVEILQASPDVRLRIEGHCDERGSVEYNLALGNRRAEAVRQFLVNYGIDESRLETVSYGQERPLVAESNESAWAQNRRAEFIVTAGGDQINPPSE